MSSPSEPDSDAISMFASVGAPLFVGAILVNSAKNGQWGSIAFVGLIFLIVLAVYIRLFLHDELEDPDVPSEDVESTCSEGQNLSEFSGNTGVGHEPESSARITST